MPIYDIACRKCGTVTETVIPLADFMKELLPCDCGGERFRQITAPRVMSDIEPYQAVAMDVATGNAPMITSRSQHREFLKRNNLTEVGNETPIKPRTETITDREIGRQVKQVIEQKGIRL